MSEVRRYSSMRWKMHAQGTYVAQLVQREASRPAFHLWRGRYRSNPQTFAGIPKAPPRTAVATISTIYFYFQLSHLHLSPYRDLLS